MTLVPQPGGARALLEASLPADVVGLAWLGQAGFTVRARGRRLLIDPYLSDHLARKYAGKEFPHVRLMPPPVDAGALRNLDLVLCSHRHSDHMDPGALPELARNNPRCRFVVPRAEREHALGIGLDESRLVPVNDGDSARVSESLEIRVIASAHETLQTNARGEHHFLGFVLRAGTLTLYHAGDCVVYEGLAQRLREQRVDVALLPVNGRSAALTARGVPGNMSFAEARDLCAVAGISLLVPHHFGMFAFNTADPAELRRQIAETVKPLCVLPEADKYYQLAAGHSG
jgi:L-ascorbate metabolism protein UlaG (beta-lactamase superfamily)